MATTSRKLAVKIERIRLKDGYAAVAFELAASVGWQARWYGVEQDGRAKIIKAAELLTQAADLLEQLENQEERNRKAVASGA